MKLRNKKTGKIWEIPKMRYPTAQEDDISFFAMLGTKGELFCYRSIVELNEDWEDYTPAEPLIKDEKIRKAVRAWAEINGIYNCDHLRYDRGCQSLSDIYTRNEISFNYKFETLDDGKEYTIAELCGEEE